VRNLVIGALVSLVVAGYVAAGFLSYLLTEHPLAFIALSSSNRNLALASGDLSAWSFFVVAFVRLLAPDPLFFLLGRWYGDAATRWMERKSPSYGQLMRQIERWFTKARYAAVVIAPNNPVCLLAGASTMAWAPFLVANVVGTIGRLVLIRLFSGAFENPLGAVRGFIGDYQKPLLVITLALVAFSIWSERRAGRDRIGDLVHLDDEIAEVEARGSGDGSVEPARHQHDERG
jgi:membrane protein DedA with SNARE-associated domain